MTRALMATGDPEDLVTMADVTDPAQAPNESLIGVEAFSINRGETFLLRAPWPVPKWWPSPDLSRPGWAVNGSRSGRSRR